MHRAFLAFAIAAVAACAAEPPFALPPLPYAPDALEPAIDAQTMAIHHGKHHQAYVAALNKAVAADPALAGLGLEEILARASSVDPVVRNNAGGHWNHSLFWTLLAPAGQGGEPSPELAARIERDFGSRERMQAAFQEAGAKRFGSGWVWLVWTGSALAVTSTPNQDNPLMDDAAVRGVPILANDVWEHAYYLKHQNKRGDYLAGWWQVVDWRAASRRFADAAAAR